jgi:hypothetical protein
MTKRITRQRSKKKIRLKRNISEKFLIGMIVIVFLLFIIAGIVIEKIFDVKGSYFLSSNSYKVTLYNDELKPAVTMPRGLLVSVKREKPLTDKQGGTFYRIIIKGKKYYVAKDNLVIDKKQIVREKVVYVRTPIDIYKNIKAGQLLTLVNKGDELEVLDYDKVLDDGHVNIYQVKIKDKTGYIYSEYTVLDKDEALLHYQPEQYYKVHQQRNDTYGGGSAGNLDYYPVSKPLFDDNVMPDPIYALYLNSSSNVIRRIDEYIKLVEGTKINAFVVDIKDNESPGYRSKVMEAYSPINYRKANNSFETYQAAIKKLKAAGFYVIGRITVFKDKYYVLDHPEHGIINTKTNEPLLHQNTYWPSPFQRGVWEFNVSLAKEAVLEMGFNEIQFDYVRFPDLTSRLEKEGIIDFRNIYQEEKAQVCQRFLMYARDQLHPLKVYVGVDVFGESAHAYVTPYGQYWPALSNVVDVISGMPYPDHFNKYEYGFKVPVWTVPYELLNYWGKNYVMVRQKEIPTPAKLRTWVQAYDVLPNRDNYVEYNAEELEQQIRGLFDAGLVNGYMTWHGGSSINKYKQQLEAYQKEYQKEEN